MKILRFREVKCVSNRIADKMLGLALNLGLSVLERFLNPSGSPPAGICKALGVGARWGSL